MSAYLFNRWATSAKTVFRRYFMCTACGADHYDYENGLYMADQQYMEDLGYNG